MRTEDRKALVAQLAVAYPIFAPSTIERWVTHAASRYEAAHPAADALPLVARAVRATLDELSREGVATGVELPVARWDEVAST